MLDDASQTIAGFCITAEEFSEADLETLFRDICLTAVEVTFCGCHMARIEMCIRDSYLPERFWNVLK